MGSPFSVPASQQMRNTWGTSQVGGTHPPPQLPMQLSWSRAGTSPALPLHLGQLGAAAAGEGGENWGEEKVLLNTVVVNKFCASHFLLNQNSCYLE